MVIRHLNIELWLQTRLCETKVSIFCTIETPVSLFQTSLFQTLSRHCILGSNPLAMLPALYTLVEDYALLVNLYKTYT